MPRRVVLNRVVLVLAVTACTARQQTPAPPPQPDTPATAAERAAELEKRADAALRPGDSSSAARASELWAQAAQQWRIAGNDSATAAAFERAGGVARLAGDTTSAFKHYGSAVQARDTLARGRIRDVLEESPLALRDAEAEAAFVGAARALMVGLGILDVAGARKSIRNAIQAFTALEDLAAGSNEVLVELKSLPDSGLEVRMRRWITRYKNPPWTTVRTNTTLVRPPMHYEFCYIDPETKLPMLVDQPCADGCKVVLPSAHATSARDTNPPCAGGS